MYPYPLNLLAPPSGLNPLTLLAPLPTPLIFDPKKCAPNLLCVGLNPPAPGTLDPGQGLAAFIFEVSLEERVPRVLPKEGRPDQ